MTPEDQRIAIAKACGIGKFSIPHTIPDYLNDLNAMHEAEKVLTTPDQKTDYIRLLNKGDFGYRRLAFATAAQRAEAFLRTLGLWKKNQNIESKPK